MARINPEGPLLFGVQGPFLNCTIHHSSHILSSRIVYPETDTLIKQSFDELFDLPFILSVSLDAYDRVQLQRVGSTPIPNSLTTCWPTSTGTKPLNERAYRCWSFDELVSLRKPIPNITQ